MEDPGTPDQGERLGGLVRPYVIDTSASASADIPRAAQDEWYVPPGQIIARVPDEPPAYVADSDQPPTTRHPIYRQPVALAAAGIAALVGFAILASPHQSPAPLAGKCPSSGCQQITLPTPIATFPVTITSDHPTRSSAMPPSAHMGNMNQSAGAIAPVITATRSPSAPVATPSCDPAPWYPPGHRDGSHTGCWGQGGPGHHRHHLR
jgi:hypothetical protein